MGYKLAGCDVVAACDIDKEMAEHYKANHHPVNYFLMPIKGLLDEDLSQFINIDILDGSPPCSTFSMAGNREKDWGKEKKFREGQSVQVLSDLFFDFLDVAEVIKPKVIIAENVKGMIAGNAKGYCRMIFARLREMGYKPQLFLLNAADCGVPQKRERVFFCALRNDINKPELQITTNCRWITAGEATADLQELTEEERKASAPTGIDKLYWAQTPPGISYSKTCMRMHGKNSYFNQKRLHKDQPCNTIPGNAGGINHWAEMRKITFREAKRLASFPDDYWAKTDRIGKYMIGMSVPPKMMEVIARAVCKQWL